jgi:ribosomal protein L7Ae-like RNA K-turn-binding protein
MDTMQTEKLLSALGLCVRAGKVIFGVPMICDALKKGGANKPVLIIEASDTSYGTHKKIADKSAFYQVRTVRIDCDGATLASALGKTASLAAVAIKDKDMCKIVEKYI